MKCGLLVQEKPNLNLNTSNNANTSNNTNAGGPVPGVDSDELDETGNETGDNGSRNETGSGAGIASEVTDLDLDLDFIPETFETPEAYEAMQHFNECYIQFNPAIEHEYGHGTQGLDGDVLNGLEGAQEINSILLESQLQLPPWKVRQQYSNVAAVQETCQRNELIVDTDTIARDLVYNTNFDVVKTLENMQNGTY